MIRRFGLLLALGLTLAAPAFAQTTVVVTTIVATAAPAQPTNDPSYVDDAAFQRAVLNSTNTFRSQHNASNLAWNDTLADFGRDYAQRCEWAHTVSRPHTYLLHARPVGSRGAHADGGGIEQGGPYGENLVQGYPDVAASIDAWGNERRLYDFAAGAFAEPTGHFTQLVWKGTAAVGCGRRFCDGANEVSGWYVVCEYSPRGNIVGAFRANVQARTDGTPTTGEQPSGGSATPTGAPSASSTSRAGSLVGSVGTLAMHALWVAMVAAVLVNI